MSGPANLYVLLCPVLQTQSSRFSSSLQGFIAQRQGLPASRFVSQSSSNVLVNCQESLSERMDLGMTPGLALLL